MKKTVFTFLTAGLLLVTGLKAQTVQEGKNHLYADRFTSAIKVFENLLATNPNNIEATYWLGQTYLEMDEIAGARVANTRQLYEKALQTSANAPLLIVGIGHVQLRENKTAEARQSFETALTMTRTKKGDDPVILAAVGRANAESKTGDYNYAIEKLSAAADKGDKNADVFLQLGNAYRRARPGEGGGEAFKNYKKALEIDPAYAIADLRLAKLFESQKNWELFLEYLNDAVKRDPKYTPAYYEMFYYYFFRAKFPEAEEQLNKYTQSKLPETDIQDEYLNAQLYWARKDFGTAITKAENVVAKMGDLTKPKVYRLLADAYYQKADYTNAKKYSDLFFLKKNPEDVILPDYETKALILGKLGGSEEEVYSTYLAGASVDTTLEAKIDFLKKGATLLGQMKLYTGQSKLLEKLIELKPKPSINDYFDLTLAYYRNDLKFQSRDQALKMIEKFPDQVYGYEWAFNNSIALTTDTTKPAAYRDSLKLAIAGPDALKMYEFSKADTTKFKKQYLSSVRYLAPYYINDIKDKDKSLEFFAKWLEADPANSVTIQSYIDQIKKMQMKPAVAPKGNAPPAKPAAVKATATKTTTKTTVIKKAVVKK